MAFTKTPQHIHRRTDGRWIITGRDGSETLYYRAVMAAKLGRELLPEEQVHHINGDRADDRPENLVVLSCSEHTRLHMRTRPSRQITVTCDHCGSAYLKYPSQIRSSTFCSRWCRAAAQSAGTFLTGRAKAISRVRLLERELAVERLRQERDQPSARSAAAQERLARALLAPRSGNVIAFPTRKPRGAA